MRKEDFSNELLSALDHAKKLTPPEDVLKRMEVFALAQLKEKNKFSSLSLMGIAASFLIILSANFYVLNNASNSYEISDQQIENQYDLIPAKSLYHE